MNSLIGNSIRLLKAAVFKLKCATELPGGPSKIHIADSTSGVLNQQVWG